MKLKFEKLSELYSSMRNEHVTLLKQKQQFAKAQEIQLKATQAVEQLKKVHGTRASAGCASPAYVVRAIPAESISSRHGKQTPRSALASSSSTRHSSRRVRAYALRSTRCSEIRIYLAHVKGLHL